MVKISIIVAAYNVALYIKKCVNSLLNQTLKEIQIIVVNDGSTDQTDEMLRSIKDQRLIYVKKDNGGLSDARNFGMQYAIGEYLAFVDGDDFCENNMYELLYKKAVTERLDLVECYYFQDYQDHSIIKSFVHGSHGKIIFNPAGQWNKIIKTEIVKTHNLKFLVDTWYEDFNFNTKLVPFLNNIGIIPIPLYHYVQRNNSIMHSMNYKITDIYIACNDIILFYKNRIIYDEFKTDLEYLFCQEILLSSGLRCLAYDKSNKTSLLEKNYAYLNTHFPKWRQNKYMKRFCIQNLCMLCMNRITMKFILSFIRFLKNSRNENCYYTLTPD